MIRQTKGDAIYETTYLETIFHLLLQARLPWFYILVYTLLSMAASQLYLLFPPIPGRS